MLHNWSIYYYTIKRTLFRKETPQIVSEFETSPDVLKPILKPQPQHRYSHFQLRKTKRMNNNNNNTYIASSINTHAIKGKNSQSYIEGNGKTT